MKQDINAGYYLMKKSPINFGSEKDKTVATCSGCINILAFDVWAWSWTGSELDEKERLTLGLNENDLKKIQEWTDKKFNEDEIGFGNVFPKLELILEFKNLFYKDNQNLEILTVAFCETEAMNLIEDFSPGKNLDFNYNNGEFGLRKNLLKRNKVVEDSITSFLGYDFIGVECDGSFHSFYCHDITKELIRRFGLRLNEHGLFENIEEAHIIREYLNTPKNGLEPVPWYIVKVKRINTQIIPVDV